MHVTVNKYMLEGVARVSLSLGDVDVNAEVGLLLDVGLEVGHLEVVVDPVDHEVGEPGGLSRGLEQLIEELQTLLPEVVPEHFETHQCRVVEQTLCQERQPVILDVVVCHIQVHQTLILGNSLCKSLSTVVRDLIGGEVQ